MIFPHRQAPRGTVQLAGAGEDDPRRRRALPPPPPAGEASRSHFPRSPPADAPCSPDGRRRRRGGRSPPAPSRASPSAAGSASVPAPEGEVVGTWASRKPIEGRRPLRREPPAPAREAAADETAGSGNDCPASGEGRFQMGRGHRPHCPRKGPLAARLPSCGVDERTGAGTLFVVATPIGNLEDLSPAGRGRVARGALDRLRKQPGGAAAQDPGSGFRDASSPAHDHNEGRRAQSLVRRPRGRRGCGVDLRRRHAAAFGPRLPHRARRPPCEPPGAGDSGPVGDPAALSVAGLPTDVFSFFGFPPARRGAKRRNFLLRAAAAPGSLVFFESAVRAARLLEELDTILGEREASLSRKSPRSTKTTGSARCPNSGRGRNERRPAVRSRWVVGPKRRRPAPA